jgi:lipopolysaccharide transport system ATP-binding protein
MRIGIEIENLNIDFPVYSNTSRSIKKQLFNKNLFKRVSKIDSNHVAVNALKNLNLSIKSGERVGILGKNGAGKSTLLRVLNGIYQPSSGKLTIRGTLNALIDIGLGLDAEATGRENIFLQGLLLRMPYAAISSKLEEIIEFSELGEFIDLPISSYSSGMLLRLAFSIYTSAEPNILVMDEWLSVGDINFQKKAECRLLNMVESSQIVIMASHSEELVRAISNRVIWMEGGEIVMDGAPDIICKKYFGIENE